MTKRIVANKPRLTKWFDGRKFVPFHIGEYNASIEKNCMVLRWWNGVNWSVPYYDGVPDVENLRAIKTFACKPINCRGLAVKAVQP